MSEPKNVYRLVDASGDARSQGVGDLLADAVQYAEVRAPTLGLVILARIEGDTLTPYVDVAGMDLLQTLGLLRKAEAILIEESDA